MSCVFNQSQQLRFQVNAGKIAVRHYVPFCNSHPLSRLKQCDRRCDTAITRATVGMHFGIDSLLLVHVCLSRLSSCNPPGAFYCRSKMLLISSHPSERATAGLALCCCLLSFIPQAFASSVGFLMQLLGSPDINPLPSSSFLLLKGVIACCLFLYWRKLLGFCYCYHSADISLMSITEDKLIDNLCLKIRYTIEIPCFAAERR